MNKTTLVIMAAGMGSRFGAGIKQLEHVGPNGEILMDYSIFDAVKAGFDDVLIVIRKDIEDEFKRLIGDRISKHVKLNYVYQDMFDIPDGFSVPEGRKKPWGTGHAILSIRKEIKNPFAIINADDYYGYEGFKAIHDYLADMDPESNDYCMVGYVLGNTLSDHGTVTRGVCKYNENYMLTSVSETFELIQNGDMVDGKDGDGVDGKYPLDTIVSMNMWGASLTFIKYLEERFAGFLADNTKDPLKKEYLLPNQFGELIDEKIATVKVLPVNEKWFGMTYLEDKPLVVSAIEEKINSGCYPACLWED